MVSILNFDEVKFQGKLERMQTIFLNQDNYSPSKYYTTKFKRGMAARTMDVLYEALSFYKRPDNTPECYVASIAKGFVSEIRTGSFSINVMLQKKRDGSYFIKINRLDNTTGVVKSISVPDRLDKAAIFLALMPVIMSDEEAKVTYDTMSDYLELDCNDEAWELNQNIQDFSKLLNVFSTNVEMRITTIAGETPISLDLSKLSPLKICDMTIEPVEVYAGSIGNFKTENNNKEIIEEIKLNTDFEKSYTYNPNRQFSEEETNLMAKISGKYVMPDFVPEICEYFKESSDFPAPMRVAYLIGPAGTGKTEGANAIFAGLGLPGGHYTCNPQTEIFDFIGQVFPNTGTDENISFDSVRTELGLPSTEDVINDPESAYEQVYGKSCTGYPDEGQIIVEMINRVMTAMQEKNTNGKNFTYVESGLIKAARMGWGFEIQEIGCVLRPGVAVGLNALLETGGNAYITLPTGEVIKKHPDCTFIFTSNDEYEGCCNLNQSVLDRMSLVYRIENPPKSVMKERIMARLNFPDEKILDRMIDTIYNISKASKEKDIVDGVCGYRALENWAMAVMIKSKKLGYISDEICYQTAITCVMNKVSQKAEYIEELMSSLTYYFAAPNNI